MQKKEFSGKWRILKVIGKISTDTKGGKGGIAMELRRFQEELEEKILGEYAAKSSRTRGRRNKRKVESGKWRDLGDADCHSQRSRWLRNK